MWVVVWFIGCLFYFLVGSVFLVGVNVDLRTWDRGKETKARDLRMCVFACSMVWFIGSQGNEGVAVAVDLWVCVCTKVKRAFRNRR